MPKIKPPRKPKGENLKVTIGNQDNQIRLLISRCEDWERKFHEADMKAGFRNADLSRRDSTIKDLETSLGMANAEVQYSRGYIARVKETDRHMYGEFPIGSAG